MVAMSRLGIASGLLLVEVMIGTGRAQAPPPPGRASSPPLEGPATELEPIPAAADPRRGGATAPEGETPGATHDALQAPEARTRADRVYSRQPPPAPIVERPAGARPGRRAQWVPGYWDWDTEAKPVRLGRRHLAGRTSGIDLGGRPLETRRWRLVPRPGILEPTT